MTAGRAALLFALLTASAGAQRSDVLRAVVFQADCPDCTAAVVNLLRQDPVRHWDVRVATGHLPAALKGTDLIVFPGGNEDVTQTWARLGPQDIAAVQTFVRRGGHYLGICMGAFLAGNFNEGTHVGWRWLTVDTYTGPMKGNNMEALVKTKWVGQPKPRWLYFSEGATFGPALPGQARTVARYENGDAAAVLLPVGRGAVGVIGPHPEADADWYDLQTLGDPDGYDADLFYSFLGALLGIHAKP